MFTVENSSVFFPMKGVWCRWGSLVVLAVQRSFLCNSLYELWVGIFAGVGSVKVISILPLWMGLCCSLVSGCISGGDIIYM